MSITPMMARRPAPTLCTWWILLCAYCSLAGWGLSLVHALNAAGYGVALAAGLLAAGAVCRRAGVACLPILSRGRFLRRFRRPLPLGFLILAVLAFLGGALDVPSNWDALAYRVPRVLHWLGAGHWHWIHTMFERVNVRGCGYEWMMAPLIALTKSDRLLFLPSFISFCLLPGLFYSAQTGVGVRRRAAWAWMWVLPSGYCYLLQAGSLGNDLFGSFFALAAFAYALRARSRQNLEALWISALAMALSTGVKANNLLLVPVWAVALFPCWRLLKARLPATAAVAVVALAVSLFPTAAINAVRIHDWTGTKADGMEYQPGQAFERVVGNSAVVLVVNLTPPVAPFAKAWNTQVAPRLLSRRFDEAFGVAPGSPVLQIDELQTEESAGLGFGVCLLLVVSAIDAVRFRRAGAAVAAAGPRWFRWAVFGATALALAVFIGASFPTKSEARLLNAYYAFLVLPFLVAPGQEWVVRRRWWRGAALAVMALAILPLALSPARPLVPVQAGLNLLAGRGLAPSLLDRAQKVYSVYSRRGEALRPLAARLPAGTRVVGMITFDDLETSLWKPFGCRRVVHVCPGDTPEQVRAQGVRFIWINSRQFARFDGVRFEDWLRRLGAEVVERVPLTLRGSEGATEWQLVRLN